MDKSSYAQVWNMIKALGGKAWAYYGKSVVYIRNGKLWVYRLDNKYSVSVSEQWCRKWLLAKRKMIEERFLVDSYLSL